MSKLYKKYLRKKDIQTLQELTNEMREYNTIVTCMGLYNHGKSTLLNCLINDYNLQTFKTADIRETYKNKSVKYGDFTFVDTPGLNANKNDDKRVMDAVKKSDINIFVHNVNTGEFVASEIDFFNSIKKYWSNPAEFLNRTIFVLSRIDEVNSKQDIISTANRMKQQLNDIFNIKNIKIIPVSSIDYIDGKLENEKELVVDSNILKLEKEIRNIQSKFSKEIIETKKYRLSEYYDILIKQLNSKLQKKQLMLSSLIKEEAQKSSDLVEIKKTLKKKYENLRSI